LCLKHEGDTRNDISISKGQRYRNGHLVTEKKGRQELERPLGTGLWEYGEGYRITKQGI
jgi:hypothetical protein